MDYTDQIILYMMLVAGLKDIETQEDLLSLDDLNLETAATKAVAKEAAKFSQSEMSSEKINRMSSSYRTLKKQTKSSVS